MNEERLKELEQQVNSLYGGDGPSDDELLTLIAAARRCNELEAERDALKEIFQECKDDLNLQIDIKSEYEDEIDTLRANNAALQEALEAAGEEICCRLGDCTSSPVRGEPIHSNLCYQINEALASPPADSLSEYRNQVLEEVDKRILTCCSVCSDGIVNGQDCPSCTVLRLTVRAMRTTNDTD